jgi:hypothetical protein
MQVCPASAIVWTYRRRETRRFSRHATSEVRAGEGHHSDPMHLARRCLAQGSSSRYAGHLRSRHLPYRRAICRSATTYAGAYTTARTVNRDAVFELNAHINRLASSCQQMLENDAKVRFVLAPRFNNAPEMLHVFLLVTLMLLQRVYLQIKCC